MENGVDFPRGRADPEDAAELRAELGVEGHGPVFIFVGRLLWYKGIRHILDSLKILDEKNIDFRMMFVGDGADRAEIEACVDELMLLRSGLRTDKGKLRRRGDHPHAHRNPHRGRPAGDRRRAGVRGFSH